MVNSTKNKLKKRKVSKNSKRKPSSNQKENKPKNGKNNNCKVTKADLTGAIAMSKQLAMKKNTHQTKRQTSRNTNRVCGNGRPLPSLAELEKYFEDSDGEENTSKTKSPEPCKTPTSTEQTEEVKVEDKLLSPKTISKISERMLNMISDISDPTELLNITPPPVVPPKKHKKSETPYIVGCNERPKVTSKPNTNFCKGDEDYGVEPRNEVDDSPPPKRAKRSNIRPYSKSIFNAQSDKIAERLTDADTNYESSDSDKTIEYMPSPVQSQRPPSFSPLPSTSQDRETFIKNDELFNQSLREQVVTKEPTPKEEKKDNLVLDKPETIVNDDLVGEPSTLQPIVNKISNSDVEIIEPVQTNSLVNAPIQNSVSNSQNNSDHPMIDCDEYKDIHVENDNKLDTIEIIDVDDVIAKNQSIIDKWKGNGSNDISKSNTACNNTTQPTPRAPEVPVSKTVPIPARLNHDPDTYDSYRRVTPMTSKRHQSYLDRRDSRPLPSRNALLIPSRIVLPLPHIPYHRGITIFEVVYRFFHDDNVRNLLNIQRRLPAPKKIRVSSLIKDIFSRFINNAVPQPMTTANTLPSATNVSTANARNTPILVPTTNTLSRPTNMPTGTARATPVLVPEANTLARPTNVSTANASTTPVLVPEANTLPMPTNVSTANALATPILVPETNTLPRPTNMPIDQASTTPILVPETNTLPRPTNMPIDQASTTPILVPTANTPPTPTGNARSTPILVPTANSLPRPTNILTGGSARTTPILAPTANTLPRPTANTLPSSQPRPTQTVLHMNTNNRGRSSFPKRNPKNQETPKNSSTSKVSSNHDKNLGECPICMDLLSVDNGMASTICGHVFCLKCLQAAIAANGHKCPTCRELFACYGPGYHQLYL